MKPLDVKVEQFGAVEGISDNIKYALNLGLEELPLGLVRHDGTFVIVGSGPSVVSQLENIRAEYKAGRPICAVNGANDFLLENDIVPSIFLTVDPRAMTGVNPRPHVNNLKHLHQNTIYALASRVHPTTFDHVKDHKVVLWHCYGEENENELLKGHLMVGGGTTSGLRAISFGYIQGFRLFHLYGMDSCLGEKNEKRYNTESLIDTVTTIGVKTEGGKEFLCNMAMAAQANEFQNLWDRIPDLHVKVYGGGLLAAIIEERNQRGLPT